MADSDQFKVLAAYADDPARTSWQDGPPAWRQWVEANCKSRADVIRVLREAMPIESSVALGVQFVDADGQTYSLEVRIGQWFRIVRWVNVHEMGLGCQDPGPEAAFAPQSHLSRLLREWTGGADKEVSSP